MKIVLQLVSGIALAATILPSCLFLAGSMDLDQTKWVMLIATLVWFATAPFWMGRSTELPGEEVI